MTGNMCFNDVVNHYVACKVSHVISWGRHFTDIGPYDGKFSFDFFSNYSGTLNVYNHSAFKGSIGSCQ